MQSSLPEASKGIIFYTNNELNPKIAELVQNQLEKISVDKNISIVSASYSPMNFGKNIVVPVKGNVLSMFQRILAALENSTADIVYFCEADVLYHPTHFDFTPIDKNIFYYNENVWKLDAKSGHALHYDCRQVSGIAVYRDIALRHYRKRVEMVSKNGFSMKMGYEPGTHGRPERVDDSTSDGYMSQFPNVDIRHDNNLSPTRWRKDQFRNQRYTKGWIESDSEIPGWGKTSELISKFN